jgi:hypothetical protein
MQFFTDGFNITIGEELALESPGCSIFRKMNIWKRNGREIYNTKVNDKIMRRFSTV